MNIQDICFKLLTTLRLLVDYSHSAHHNVKGALFFADHKELNKFYDELVEDFDRAGEKYVSLYGAYNIQSLLKAMLAESLKLPTGEVKENKDYFTALLGLEKELCAHVDIIIKTGGFNEGTKDIFIHLASRSEERQYKIKRRIM